MSVTKQLLKAGANVNVQGLENDTPLHDASGNGHTEVGLLSKANYNENNTVHITSETCIMYICM